jgi:hypothetical protein
VKTQSAIQVPSSSLVNWAEQPLLLIRKICLSFIQGLFEQADQGCFHWNESLEETEIVITDESPIKLDVVGKRPAISTVRGQVAWGKTSLDEMQSRNMATDQIKHTDLLSGNMTFNCCSREPLETEYIAWVVANHTWLLRRLIMKYTPVHEFGRGQAVGAPSPAGAIVSGDTEGEWICTPVMVPFFLQITGKVTPLNLTLLKAIEARFNLRGGAQIGPTGVRGQATKENTAGSPAPGEEVNVRPPTIRGRPIRNIAFEQSISVKKES